VILVGKLKRRNVWLPIALVLAVAASIWFAGPTLGAIRPSVPQGTILRGAYLPNGELIILKKDANTFQIINAPGFTVTITPNPFTGTGSLTVQDNQAGVDSNPANGTIDIKNVLASGVYTVVEIGAPLGYQVVTTPLTVTISPGNLVGTVTSLDPPLTNVPASSNLGMLVLIGGMALAMALVILGRGRLVRGSGGARKDS
jgi:hypothetical protein